MAHSDDKPTNSRFEASAASRWELRSSGFLSSEYSEHYSLRNNLQDGSAQQIHIWKCAFVGLSYQYGPTSESKPHFTLTVSFRKRFVPTESSTNV